MFIRNLALALCLAAATGTAFAGTFSGTDYIAATIPVPSISLGSTKYSTSVTVYYPAGLAASSFVTHSQIATDVQTFTSAGNTEEPPEAFFSVIASSLLKKYPQMTAATLTGTFAAIDLTTFESTVESVTVSLSSSPGATASALPGNRLPAAR